eukprot:Gb_31888 [translate_table: standard]
MALISQRRRLMTTFKFINNHNHVNIFSNHKVHKSIIFSDKFSFYSTACKNPSNFRTLIQVKGASVSAMRFVHLQGKCVYGYTSRYLACIRQIYSETLGRDHAQYNGVEEQGNNDGGYNPLAKELNEICRLLSDYRRPHHDLEAALDKCCVKMSPDLVEQVLKRCSNLGVPAHRFFGWAGRQPGYKHSSEGCNIMIDILGNIRQFDTIWRLLTEMEKEGILITHKTFSIVIKRYARAHLAQDAIQTFRSMSKFNCKPDIDDLNTLLSTLCKNKLVSDAHHFYEKVKSRFLPNVKTFSILIKSWGDYENPAQAKRIFQEMIEQKCDPDIVIYNTLLNSLCKGGKLEEAYQIFDEMKVTGPVPDVSTYSTFIHAHCKANQLDDALKVLGRMKRYGLVPNVVTYNSLLQGFCKMGKVDDAYQLLDEMVRKGVDPDVWSYNTIFGVHCKLREVKIALRLLQKMDDNGCKPDLYTYNMLIKMLVSIGRFDRALDVWDGMEERGFYPAVTTYAALIHGFCKKRKYEEACKYFKEMIDEGIPPYPCTCELLKNCLLQLGDRRTVQILADKMQASTSCSIQELSKTMNQVYSIKKKKQPKSKYAGQVRSKPKRHQVT